MRPKTPRSARVEPFPRTLFFLLDLKIPTFTSGARAQPETDHVRFRIRRKPAPQVPNRLKLLKPDSPQHLIHPLHSSKSTPDAPRLSPRQISGPRTLTRSSHLQASWLNLWEIFVRSLAGNPDQPSPGSDPTRTPPAARPCGSRPPRAGSASRARTGSTRPPPT